MVGQVARSLREANTAVVVERLRGTGPVSRADLARSTGLAKQTVSTIVATLLADGVAREVGRGAPEAGGGRPATLVEYAADRAFVAGVEIGVGRTRVVLADALGARLLEREVPVAGDGPAAGHRSPGWVLGAVAEVLAEVAAQAAPEAPGTSALSRLRAVGVSVTGLVQPTTGTCLLAPNLGWRDVPLAALLDRVLRDRGVDVPLVVRGAAQCSLIAEHREGAAAGEDDVVLVFEDEGVGAAVVEAGRLVDGADGTAGELGHCLWPGADRRCGCGRNGCVETVASGPAVRRAVEERLGTRLELPAGAPTLAALADLVGVAGLEVEAAAAEAGRVLGTAASWLVELTAPRVLVLSGALVPAPPALREALEGVVRGRALAEHEPRVVLGALGDGAALRGAVLLALDAARSRQPA